MKVYNKETGKPYTLSEEEWNAMPPSKQSLFKVVAEASDGEKSISVKNEKPADEKTAATGKPNTGQGKSNANKK